MARYLSLVVSLLMLWAVPAGATPAQAIPDQALPQISDGNDTPGVLDVDTLLAARAAPGEILTIEVATFRDWTNRLLHYSKPNKMIVLFNVDSDARAEYKGVVSSGGGKLYITVSGSGSNFESLRVRRPDARTMKAILPEFDANPNGPVSIAVKTLYRTKTGKCSNGCRDRAPDAGYLSA